MFSKGKLPGKRDRGYVINIDNKQSKGAHWVALFVEGNNCVLRFLWDWRYSVRSIKVN